MLNSNAEKLFRDLLFEILGEKEAKLLFVVCDDDAESKRLQEALRRALATAHKKLGVVVAPDIAGSPLDEFYKQSRAGTVDTLLVWGLQRVPRALANQVLAELNFRRDAVLALKLPIVLWLNNEVLARLPSIAPDFWSRRTAIYRFTRQSTKELLKRLFDRGHGRSYSPAESAISKVVKQIGESERQLSKCIRSHSFKVEDADALIIRIQDNITALRAECTSGNPIGVALHLWRLAQLDKVLEQFIDGLSIGDRNVYEYLYTDRNEALLFTAERLPSIFDEYILQLPSRIRRKRRPNLIVIFRSKAIDKLNSIAADLESRIGISIDQLPSALLIDDSEDSDAEEPLDTVESALGAQASYDLESWLTGYNDERPPVFSASEGELLKLLYSEQPDIESLSSRIGMSIAKTRKEIHRLEEKVRLFLATSETSGRAKQRTRPAAS